MKHNLGWRAPQWRGRMNKLNYACTSRGMKHILVQRAMNYLEQDEQRHASFTKFTIAHSMVERALHT